MHYFSIFSGIEAASAAWKPLGWTCVGFAEIESFPCKVLAHHYPDVPNFGDVTKITEADIMCLGNIDLIIFGSPCQDLSVAGKRKGLAGERSGLFHTAINIIEWARIHCGLRWALWENVPGAFTSNSGRDFAAVVESLAGVEVAVPPKGWGTEGCAIGKKGMVEWAVLDAQWFGVAQRRRRVFALADFGDWSRRPPVLLEPESVRGDSAPSRRAGQSVAGTLTRGVGERGAEDGKRGLLHVTHALTANGFDASEDGTGRGTPIVPAVSMYLNAGGMGRIDAESETLIAFNYNAQAAQLPTTSKDTSISDSLTCSQGVAVCFSSKDYGGDASADVAPTMRAMGHSESHANAGGQLAVAYDFLGTPASEVAKETDVHVPLRARKPGQFENSTVTAVVTFAQNQLGEIRVGESHANAGGQLAVAFTDTRGDSRGSGIQVTGDIANTLHCAKGVSEQQAVAFAQNQLGEIRVGEVANTINTNSNASGRNTPMVQTDMQVRRLTPRECERLQGFPETKFTLTIEVCEDEKTESAPSAALDSVAQRPEQSAPVAAHVLIDYERMEVQRLRVGRFNCSAPGAVASSLSLHPTLSADSVRLAALTAQCVEQAMRGGREALLPSISGSFRPLNGSAHVRLSGRVIKELADDAGRLTSEVSLCTKSITSQLGPDSPSFVSNLETSLYCVAAAIVSCIPKPTSQTSSFAVIVETTTPYTLIHRRGKPADQCPDGPRYKALGNSMAVPVINWIGRSLRAASWDVWT